MSRSQRQLILWSTAQAIGLSIVILGIYLLSRSSDEGTPSPQLLLLSGLAFLALMSVMICGNSLGLYRSLIQGEKARILEDNVLPKFSDRTNKTLTYAVLVGIVTIVVVLVAARWMPAWISKSALPVLILISIPIYRLVLTLINLKEVTSKVAGQLEPSPTSFIWWTIPTQVLLLIAGLSIVGMVWILLSHRSPLYLAIFAITGLAAALASSKTSATFADKFDGRIHAAMRL